jgi:predicted CopG family antitoxin
MLKIIFIFDTFIIYNIIFTSVAKTVSVTDEAYDALVSIKRGKMTFSDVIMSMYNDLYGTVDEEEEEKEVKSKTGRLR